MSTLNLQLFFLNNKRLEMPTLDLRMEMKSALTMGTVGTFNYTAPEMMRSPNYDEKVGFVEGPCCLGRPTRHSGSILNGDFFRGMSIMSWCCYIYLYKYIYK